jgi:hypothetical protein
METIMAAEHDSPRRVRRKSKEAPDETEARLSRELAYLMRDPRYRDGDPDYRAYIQRQFRRVYDDPQPLRLGRPKVFVDGLEPFDPARERRLRLGERETTEGGQVSGVGRTRMSSPDAGYQEHNRAGTDFDTDIPQPSQRALMEVETEPRPDRSPPGQRATKFAIRVAGGRVEGIRSDDTKRNLHGVLLSAETFLDDLEIAGRHTSASLLRHYLLGTGAEVTLPAEFLSDWPLAQNAVDDVDAYFSDWMMGRLEDSRFGIPTLEIGDGERIVVGGDESGPADDLNERVRWEATFAGVGDAFFWRGNPNHRLQDFWSAVRKLEFAGEEMTTFGGATAQGFGYLVFEREGDIVTVRGVVDYRMHDIYKFDWADTVNPGFRLLQKHHIGESFEISTGLTRSYLTATIQLKDGLPASITVDRSPLSAH